MLTSSLIFNSCHCYIYSLSHFKVTMDNFSYRYEYSCYDSDIYPKENNSISSGRKFSRLPEVREENIYI